MHNFEPISQRYVPEFLQELANYGADSDFYMMARDAQATQKGAGEMNLVKGHISKYISFVELLSRGELNNIGTKEEMIDGLVKVLDPINGTPYGIGTFLKLLNNLARDMERLLDSAISGPVKKSPANNESPQLPLGRFKVDSTRVFKISKITRGNLRKRV